MSSLLDCSDLGFDIAQYFRGFSSTIMIASVLALLIIIPIYNSLRGLRTPRLQGPRSESFIFGNTRKIFPSTNLALVYQDWEQTYGPVYEIPTGFGSNHVVLSDLKAITHLFSKDTTTYCLPARVSALACKLFGRVVAAVEGETHKRLRRALSPPLSVSAIRNLTPICLDSAYQLKAAWESCFQSSDKSNNAVVIDVEKWMNSVTLDTIGKVIMSHDFGTLRGQTSSMMAAFDFIHAIKPSLYIQLIFFLAPILYDLFNVILTSDREQRLAQSVAHLNVLTTDLLSKARQEPEDSEVHRSILGILMKSQNANSNSRLSLPEITTQAVCTAIAFPVFKLTERKNFLFMAAYETTAITLTWSLIELARRPEIQETLRAELREYLAEGERPTYDQLTKDLKYLDAFISEILRFHPPEMQATRVAVEDDVIPLSEPIRTASGAVIDRLFLKKGAVVRIPFAAVNISEALWGPNAGTFEPGRWMVSEDHNKGRREEVPGYRCLLTFGAGPRVCPGRDLAVLEVKALLSVLVSNFAFKFPNGPLTELNWHFTRPKVAGEDGTKVPILVQRLS